MNKTLSYLVTSFFLFGSGTVSAVEWVAKTDLTSKEDQQLVTTLPANGFVPIYSKTTVNSDGHLRFDVVYLKPLVVAWEYRMCTDAEFDARNRDWLGRGYALVSHNTYRHNGVLYHNCIWHK